MVDLDDFVLCEHLCDPAECPDCRPAELPDVQQWADAFLLDVYGADELPPALVAVPLS